MKLGVMVIAAASFYRPLVFWARNAWDLSSPVKLLVGGLALLVVSAGVYWLFVRLGTPHGPLSLGLGAMILVLMHWDRLRGPDAGVWVLIVGAGFLSIHYLASGRLVRWLQLAAIGLLGVLPVLQVGLSHMTDDEPYPIVDLYPRTDASATGLVEDVLLLIVDGYPSFAVAEDWVGHDTASLRADLGQLGFVTPTMAWSHHTFTRLAVPSILELQPVAEPGPKQGWSNFSSTYRITRGDSFVAHVLTSAGFHYTHIESGWDGDVCGDVDTCLRSPWIDESTWHLLRPTVGGDALEATLRAFSVEGTRQTMDHLEALNLFGDGQRDYVFAHFLLPHAPFVVDQQCEPRMAQEAQEHQTSRVDLGEVRLQLECVDDLVKQVARLVGPKTAVLMTGDHGTGLRGQGTTASHVWSDADIAERLGIFMAYRLPDECPEPTLATSIAVMRAVVSCSVDVDLPQFEPEFLLGSNNPVLVDLGRLIEIEGFLSAGQLGLAIP